MIDVRYNKPLHVSMEYPPRPYIRLPFSQLNKVRQLLDNHQINYWVREYTISLDSGPEEIIIYLNRGTDVATVQAILDSVP
jgi:hypothetical protein